MSSRTSASTMATPSVTLPPPLRPHARHRLPQVGQVVQMRQCGLWIVVSPEVLVDELARGPAERGTIWRMRLWVTLADQDGTLTDLLVHCPAGTTFGDLRGRLCPGQGSA